MEKPVPDITPIALDTKAFDGGLFYVWRKNGKPPRFAHPDREAAIAEAQRLSAKYNGATFMVMQPIVRVKGVNR